MFYFIPIYLFWFLFFSVFVCVRVRVCVCVCVNFIQKHNIINDSLLLLLLFAIITQLSSLF